LQVPKNNIAIGVHHLRSLKNKYQHPVFVMTAYNASPRATKRWQENIPTEDIFFFIESIPYRETQKYVKLVFRNYFYYSQFYYRQQIKKMAMLEPVIEQAFETH
jgi:soluble lytic murein transglycosylase